MLETLEEPAVPPLDELRIATIVKEGHRRRRRRRFLSGTAVAAALAAGGLVPSALSGPESDVVVTNEGEGTTTSSSVVPQRWIVPRGQLPPPPPARDEPPTTLIGPTETPDGPRSTALAARLRPLLPSSFTIGPRHDLEHPEPPDPDREQGTYVGATTDRGQYLQVNEQQLPHPLAREDFIGRGTCEGTYEVLEDGNEIVATTHLWSGQHQVVVVTSDGRMTNVSTGGLPGRDVPVALTLDETIALARGLAGR